MRDFIEIGEEKSEVAKEVGVGGCISDYGGCGWEGGGEDKNDQVQVPVLLLKVLSSFNYG